MFASFHSKETTTYYFGDVLKTFSDGVLIHRIFIAFIFLVVVFGSYNKYCFQQLINCCYFYITCMFLLGASFDLFLVVLMRNKSRGFRTMHLRVNNS